MKNVITLILLVWSIGACSAVNKTNNGNQNTDKVGGDTDKVDSNIKFKSYNGLVMTGYQGWFNAVDDGADLGWKHYQKNSTFAPGSCTIDLWPDVSEYEKVYETEFKYSDGTPACVFSSADASTSDLHFKWMKQYGIDGAFMQRFVTSVKSAKGAKNYDAILNNAMSSAQKYGRAISVMYDLSGMTSADVDIVIKDWKKLVDTYKITTRDNNHYLHHNGKPLVTVWGIGFNDNRKYNYDDVQRLITFFKKEGCSIMVGVPTNWRTLSQDTMSDPRLHEIILQADIVHAWLVGRFNMSSYPKFQQGMEEDIKWCKANGKDYAPVIFPGFSWYNLRDGVAAPLDQISRLGGEFFWTQAEGAMRAGAKCLYLAMFDEIDEGTALFKCTNNPPSGASPFLTYKECQPDHYLWLAGQSARMLRGEIPRSAKMPIREEE